MYEKYNVGRYMLNVTVAVGVSEMPLFWPAPLRWLDLWALIIWKKINKNQNLPFIITTKKNIAQKMLLPILNWIMHYARLYKDTMYENIIQLIKFIKILINIFKQACNSENRIHAHVPQSHFNYVFQRPENIISTLTYL